MTTHRIATFILYLPIILITGCSSSNTDAPGTGRNHTARYVVFHAGDSNTDLDSCKTCHGADFLGSGNPVPSCFSCHNSGIPFAVHKLPYTNAADHGPAARQDQRSCRGCHGDSLNNFDGGIVAEADLFNKPAGSCSAAACHPAAKAHPTNWQGTNEDRDTSYASSHRSINLTTVTTSCILCHKVDGPGSGALPGAPSCFTANFTNRDGNTTGCHAGGPGYSAPHNLPFTAAASHGVVAKADLAYCQQCHGTPGTFQFDGAIAPTACSSTQCHPDARAHPTNWQGNNDGSSDYLSSHRSAGALDSACALCHNTNTDAPGLHPNAPSCFAPGFTNGAGLTTGCHASGPGAPHAMPFSDAALHGSASKADLAYCQQCHGSPGNIQFDGGSSSTGCSSAGCHQAAGAHPTRWQGTNDNTADYLSSHRNSLNQNTACAICHDFTEGRTPPNSRAPSCFSADFPNADGSTTSCHSTGPGAAHAVPFSNAALHGPEAKADLVFCQQCHADPAAGGSGSNPRFNVPLGDLTNGCEDCHTQRTAHPSPSWIGAAANSHKTAGNLAAACGLCHGSHLLGPAEGGVGRACQDCHTAGSPLTFTNCTSCHGNPPAGDTRPDRAGAHSIHNALPKVTGVCISCHSGSGTNTTAHFDSGAPANVAGLSDYNAKSGNFSYNSTTGRCSNVSCHGGQPTPVWLTEPLDVNSECERCHESGTAQFNSYNSGRHRKHVVDESVSCTRCHDTDKLAAGHFNNLDTPELEGAADLTMADDLGYNPATSQGCDVNGCHGVENWFD